MTGISDWADSAPPGLEPDYNTIPDIDTARLNIIELQRTIAEALRRDADGYRVTAYMELSGRLAGNALDALRTGDE